MPPWALLVLVLEVVAWLLVGLVSVPTAVFLVQCWAAFLGPLERRRGPRPTVAVLMPAHDEALVIRDTLGSVMHQLRDGDRVLVVADNCSDATAELARAAGAEVLERRHDTDRGKGFALAAGVDAMRDRPPGVVAVVDADCHVGGGALDVLVEHVAATQGPVQALYLQEIGDAAEADASPLGRISAFAFRVKNHVRQRGLARLGAPAVLQGSGVGYPWDLISRTELATADLVEDLAVGIDLAERGHPATFCEQADFTAAQGGDEATRSQRTRWEHGYLMTIFRRVPGLLLRGLAGRPRLLSIALDLAVPPLSLLCAALGGLTLAAAVLALGVGVTGPLVWLLALGVVFTATVCLVAARFGQGLVSPATLLMAPGYALNKLPIYLSLLRGPQATWVRTKRD